MTAHLCLYHENHLFLHHKSTTIRCAVRISAASAAACAHRVQMAICEDIYKTSAQRRGPG